MYTIYQVQNGETLASIAGKIGVPVDNLANLNGLMVSSMLMPGQYIVIPKNSVDNENAYFQKYVVKKGDTIYGISQKYGLKPAQILRLNGMNENDTIYPNEEIFVPKDNVRFYITEQDDTLNDVIRGLGATADELARQNGTIYLTNDQLIVYRK